MTNTTAPPTAGALLGLYAQTSVRLGASAAQREPDTSWPGIAGPALLGGVGDARLLGFPVRSLRGGYAWATCPAALERLVRDAGQVGFLDLPAPPAVADNEAVVADDCALFVGDHKLVLEEFLFARKDGASAAALAAWVAGHLLPTRPAYEPVRARFGRHLAVLSDGDFTHFARLATAVVARPDTAPQEFLPPETLLYAVVPAGPGLDALRGHLEKSPMLQVGEDETAGPGYCAGRLTERQ